MKSQADMLIEWRDATGGDNLSLVAWAELRKDLLREETKEACDAIDIYVETGDARPLAKELADVEYVTEGTAQRPGINLEVAFREVHRSNMSKVGPNGQVSERPDGKILKGPYYQEADMTTAVEEPAMGRLETFLVWLETTLRSIPIVTRLLVILSFAGFIGWACLSFSYYLAGGQ
jgi:predicted HAD superfamily Cof-like phosphohydrolase